jgi:hypothetical protein
VIYFFLCQKVYGSNGYFYPWCYDDSATTARKIGGGASAKSVEETVRYCFQIGLFDEGLFEGWNILTSRGIQKRYTQVALTRTYKTVIAEYWLLSGEESAGLDFRALNPNYDPVKSNYDPVKSNYSDSKVKESKVKEETSVPEPPTPPDDMPKGKPKVPTTFGKNSAEMRLCRYLAKEMRVNNPTCKIPGSPDKAQPWCKQFDLMLRLDGHTYDEIIDMIDFSQWHPFWKKNILSPGSLRDKWDRLVLEKMEAEEDQDGNNR